MTIGPDSVPVHGASTTLLVLIHGHHGSVERLLAAVRRQGCTLTNLAVEPAGHAGLARVSLTIEGGHPMRLVQQLARLVDVVDVRDTTPGPATVSASVADVALTPFRSQADGAAPGDGDPATLDTLTEG